MEIISTTRGRRDPEGGGLVEDGRSLHGIQPLAGGRQPGAQAGVRSLVERAGVLELGGGRRLPGGRRSSAVKREAVRWREEVAGKERWGRSTRTDGGASARAGGNTSRVFQIAGMRSCFEQHCGRCYNADARLR